MKAHIGIDPGMDGCIAFRNPLTGQFTIYPFEKNLVLVNDTLADLSVLCESEGWELDVMLEKVGPRPTDGKRQLAVFMRNVGEIRGALRTLGVTWQEVTPQTWKRVMLGSALPKDKEAQKALAIDHARRLAPYLPISGKCDADAAEAVLICEYGRLKTLGGTRCPACPFDCAACPHAVVGDMTEEEVLA